MGMSRNFMSCGLAAISMMLILLMASARWDRPQPIAAIAKSGHGLWLRLSRIGPGQKRESSFIWRPHTRVEWPASFMACGPMWR